MTAKRSRRVQVLGGTAPDDDGGRSDVRARGGLRREVLADRQRDRGAGPAHDEEQLPLGGGVHGEVALGRPDVPALAALGVRDEAAADPAARHGADVELQQAVGAGRAGRRQASPHPGALRHLDGDPLPGPVLDRDVRSDRDDREVPAQAAVVHDGAADDAGQARRAPARGLGRERVGQDPGGVGPGGPQLARELPHRADQRDADGFVGGGVEAQRPGLPGERADGGGELAGSVDRGHRRDRGPQQPPGGAVGLGGEPCAQVRGEAEEQGAEPVGDVGLLVVEARPDGADGLTGERDVGARRGQRGRGPRGGTAGRRPRVLRQRVRRTGGSRGVGLGAGAAGPRAGAPARGRGGFGARPRGVGLGRAAARGAPVRVRRARPLRRPRERGSGSSGAARRGGLGVLGDRARR